MDIREAADELANRIQSIREVPKWLVLRLASVTGTRPGVWVVSAVAALVGAVVALLVVLMLYVAFDRSPALSVPSELSDG